MSRKLAIDLFDAGKAHSLSCALLNDASEKWARENGISDCEEFAFNGTFSLSKHYLLSLGIELMLKSFIVYSSNDYTEKRIRDEIGHNLDRALSVALELGLPDEIPHLEFIIDTIKNPYRNHWFRYEMGNNYPMPNKFDQIVDCLSALQGVLEERLYESDLITPKSV